jgi:hypothetical protein
MRENESGNPLHNVEIVEKKNLYGFDTKSDVQKYLKITTTSPNNMIIAKRKKLLFL